MGSIGDAYDNAMCESFFATLECELLDRRRFRTKAEARIAVFQFIEGWYNPVTIGQHGRIQTRIGSTVGGSDVWTWLARSWTGQQRRYP
jgi:hypothetical protein